MESFLLVLAVVLLLLAFGPVPPSQKLLALILVPLLGLRVAVVAVLLWFVALKMSNPKASTGFSRLLLK